MKIFRTTCWYSRTFPIVCLVAAFAAMPARAVEPLADGFALWGEEEGDRFVRFDALPGTPGIELIVGGERELTLGPDVDNKIQLKFKLFMRVMDDDGASELARLSTACR